MNHRAFGRRRGGDGIAGATCFGRMAFRPDVRRAHQVVPALLTLSLLNRPRLIQPLARHFGGDALEVNRGDRLPLRAAHRQDDGGEQQMAGNGSHAEAHSKDRRSSAGIAEYSGVRMPGQGGRPAVPGYCQGYEPTAAMFGPPGHNRLPLPRGGGR